MSKQEVVPRPILKWAGGKTTSLPVILAHLPKRINTYYEPFFGGGAVFFALARAGRFDKAHISDTNRELTTTLKAVRDSLPRVIEALGRLSDGVITEARYNQIRSTPMIAEHEIAARMIFLNKACFNGLYRVNKKSGEFNTSWGKRERVFPDLLNLAAAAQALQGVSISCCSFAMADEAERGDAVYFDPPYFPVSKTANFDGYTRSGFQHSDQLRLAAMFASIAQRRVTVLASSADTQAARDIYGSIPRTEIIETTCPRAINNNGKGRGRVGELLFVANGPKKTAKERA
jgi:DNA adenine methylase